MRKTSLIRDRGGEQAKSTNLILGKEKKKYERKDRWMNGFTDSLQERNGEEGSHNSLKK